MNKLVDVALQISSTIYISDKYNSGRYKLVALLLDNSKKIVSYACNFGLRHAEMNCIANFNTSQKHKQYSLMVVRFLSDGTITNAKPCKDCIDILRKRSKYINIRKIIYSTWDGNLIEENIDIINNTHISFGNKKRYNKNTI